MVKPGRNGETQGRKERENTSTECPLCCLVISSEKIQVFLSQDGGAPHGNFRSFSTSKKLRYEPYCDDFGPMNMSSTIAFVGELDKRVFACQKEGCDKLVYVADKGRRSLTNAAYLLGAYMILKMDKDPKDVAAAFSSLSGKFEEYRDATFCTPDFGLSLSDCWQGLHRGKLCGWITRPTSDSNACWGQIDKDEYDHYDNPLNGDLHQVVPQTFVAFRGPKDLGGEKFFNNYEKKCREFSPEYYVDVFKAIGVTTVIRLNEVQYNAASFTDHGIEHHDLCFQDCTTPPADIVLRFMKIVDGSKGKVAVHCKAGLGRTGTLMALHMMRAHGFSAREAIGWLRIMRPGCVIGEQQRYLCAAELCFRRRAGPRQAIPPPADEGGGSQEAQIGRGLDTPAAAAADLRRGPLAAVLGCGCDDAPARPNSAPASPGRAAACELAAQVTAAVQRRGAARVAARSAADAL